MSYQTEKPASQARQYGAGMCVARWEQNLYHDSYFWAVFAVPQEGDGFTFKTVETGSTAFGGENNYVAVVDATPEVREAYEAFRAEVAERQRAEHAENLRRSPQGIGNYVIVVEPVTRGKNKIEAGEVGVVFWTGPGFKDRYGRPTSGPRVGIETFEGRKVFMDQDKLRVQGFESLDCLPIV